MAGEDPLGSRHLNPLWHHSRSTVGRSLTARLLPLLVLAAAPVVVASPSAEGAAFVVDGGSGTNGENDGVVYRVDEKTGERQLISERGALFNPVDVAVLSSGKLVVLDQGPVNDDWPHALVFDGRILGIDPRTGEQLTIAVGGLLVNPTALAVEADGGLLVLNRWSRGIDTFIAALIRVDPITGRQAVISELENVSRPQEVTVDELGNLSVLAEYGDAAASRRSRVFRVDPVTGAQLPLIDVEVPAPRRAPAANDEQRVASTRSLSRNFDSEGVPLQLYTRSTARLRGTTSDSDSDGVLDDVDNCVFVSNLDQADGDGDNVGDLCDNCPGDPNPRSPLLEDDFEAGAPGWTHAERGGADTWHIDDATTAECFLRPLSSTKFVSNGNAGIDCVDDSSTEVSQLLSPPISLPTAGAITLSLEAASWDEAGSCLTDATNFDRKDVGVTIDGGASYTRLNDCFPLAPGDGIVAVHQFDISSFAGQTVQIMVVYDTVDNFTGDTFSVDQVVITSNVASQPDADVDDVGDTCDNCLLIPNSLQENSDSDVWGDACDNCASVTNGGQEDGDGDGAGDLCDNCRFLANAAQQDTDLDNVGDICDNCPNASNPVTSLLQSDFESGTNGWTHAALGGADTWHLDSFTCPLDSLGNPDPSGTPVALGSQMFVSNGNAGDSCTADSTFERSRLLSPPVMLPSAGRITLAFDAQSFDEGGRCLPSDITNVDAKDVGVTVDGGSTYTLLNDCFALTDRAGTLIHHEFDISAFAGQEIRVIFVYDTFDEQLEHTFAVDNVSIVLNQPDTDGDLAGDVCDCAPNDGTVFALPNEIQNPRILQNKTTLEWDSDAAGSGTGTQYDVMQGALGEFPVGTGPAETCVDPSSVDTMTENLPTPGADSGHYYLVRGTNSCGVGTYGFASSTAERLSTVCP